MAFLTIRGVTAYLARRPRPELVGDQRSPAPCDRRVVRRRRRPPARRGVVLVCVVVEQVGEQRDAGRPGRPESQPAGRPDHPSTRRAPATAPVSALEGPFLRVGRPEPQPPLPPSRHDAGPAQRPCVATLRRRSGSVPPERRGTGARGRARHPGTLADSPASTEDRSQQAGIRQEAGSGSPRLNPNGGSTCESTANLGTSARRSCAPEGPGLRSALVMWSRGHIVRPSSQFACGKRSAHKLSGGPRNRPTRCPLTSRLAHLGRGAQIRQKPAQRIRHCPGVARANQQTGHAINNVIRCCPDGIGRYHGQAHRRGLSRRQGVWLPRARLYVDVSRGVERREVLIAHRVNEGHSRQAVESAELLGPASQGSGPNNHESCPRDRPGSDFEVVSRQGISRSTTIRPTKSATGSPAATPSA